MIGAFAFLTVLGRRSARRPAPGDLVWFPLAGAVVGACAGLVYVAADVLWFPAPAAALALVTDLVLTGLLHVDGLADSADGLLPHLPRQRRLEVMATPGVGAFGTAAVATALLLRFVAVFALGFAVTSHWRMVFALAGIGAVSRAVMAVTIAAATYARPGGLADAFGGRSPTRAVTVGLIALVIGVPALAAARTWPYIPITIAVMAAAAALVVWLAHRRLGGYTGDVLGAAGIVAEIAGLLALSAR